MPRTHTFSIPLLLGLALLAAPAGAQEPEPERSRENCIYFDRDTDDLVSRFAALGSRARIGVYLGEAEEVDGRTGVRIREVVGDGPADAAGLRDGDIITAADGTELDDDPAEALVDLITDHEPGDTVRITYYRDGERRSAEVVTDTGGLNVVSPGGFQLRAAPGRQMRGLFTPGGEIELATPRGAFLRRLAPAGLELAELNPGLGQYFGTDEGVLVLDVADEELGLRPGDVILAIDGRNVRDAAHVRAILESYRPDEEIGFAIMRSERRMEVSGTIG